MRSRKYDTISAGQIHGHAAAVLQNHLMIRDHGHKCRASVLISVLFFAASRVGSIYDACRRLRGAPSDQAVRNALVAMMPEMDQLQRRINAALSAGLPKSLRRRPRRLAIDLTLIPYHGQPFRHPREVYRSQPKSGTSHFHAYATCYVVLKGHRFTLAATYVFKDEPIKDVVKRLVRRARQIGVEPRYLLLDRGFYTIAVIRYLQAARVPFLMPVVHRGRPAKDPSRSRSTRRFAAWKKSGWGQHTLRNHQGGSATVGICVSCRNYAGRWKRRGRQTMVYAFWGFRPGTTRWVRETYRKRFGIETSYRQMNQARIRTCTRNPLFRLLFVAIALILRNAWVWFHLTLFAERGSDGRLHLNLEALRLRTMLLKLQRFAEALLGCEETAEAQCQT